MTDIEKRLFEKNGLLDEAYARKVEELIGKRYTIKQEIAISRQRETKPEEWSVYNAYCEECKARAKKEVYGEEEI